MLLKEQKKQDKTRRIGYPDSPLDYDISTNKYYIKAKNISLYGTKKVMILKPELYLIYSGNKRKKPEVLSFTEEYLEVDRKEIIDIMIQLYDREREMRLYVKEERRDAARKNTLENIKSLMKTMKWSAKEAMNALQIASNDQKTYLPMLKKGESG